MTDGSSVSGRIVCLRTGNNDREWFNAILLADERSVQHRGRRFECFVHKNESAVPSSLRSNLLI